MPAETLEKIYEYFRNRPIEPEDFDELYVPADKGRGKPVYSRLKRRLTETPAGSLKILFAGHRGCGKTTELLRLQKDIETDFIVLNFSVARELDILNISYIEIFIVTMEKLFNFIRKENRLEIDERLFENIVNWLKSKEIEEINQRHIGIDIEAGMKAGINIPFLADFFSKFRSAAKSSTSMKETLRAKVEPKLSELVLNCNLFINEIRIGLEKIGKKGLVIIVEDMDKLDVRKGEDIFYDHSIQLTLLNCHCLFTFPIALLYNIRFTAIRNRYDENYILPMIKVFEREGGVSDNGIRVMRDIVARRMKLSLFEHPDILTKMITYSGGCLWDLFKMIKDAADNALDYGRKTIRQEDYESAYKDLKQDYEFTIAENSEKGISADDYFIALAECAKDETKKPKSTDIMLDLRNNLTVLSYNDVGWSDVHPVVRDILKEKGLI